MRLNGVVSGYPTFTNIPQVDGLSTEPRDQGVTQLDVRVLVCDYLGSHGTGLEHYMHGVLCVIGCITCLLYVLCACMLDK